MYFSFAEKGKKAEQKIGSAGFLLCFFAFFCK